MPSKRGSRIFGVGDGDQFTFLTRLHWEKIAIWSLFLLCIWFLRAFFAAIFLTFIFGYIGHRVVRWICHKLGYDDPSGKVWRLTAAGVFLGFAGVVAGLGAYVAPRIVHQAGEFGDKILGPEVSPAPAPKGDGEPAESAPAIDRQQVDRILRKLLPTSWIPATGAKYQGYQRSVRELTDFLNHSVPAITQGVYRAVGGVLGFLSQLFVAYIFALLILWDLPRLGAKVQTLGQSNLKRIYDEIAPGVITFGNGMGQAFQAQTLIALLNTLLTLIGLIALGIQLKDVLSLIVFLCSFIPVLGVIISTVPIALVGLVQDGGGPVTMLLAMGLVLVIHFIEAYILNPRIYGHVMHMHPLIVLAILFIAQSIFGLWGVILGVPTCQFVFNYWIRRQKEKEAAAAGGAADPPAAPKRR